MNFFKLRILNTSLIFIIGILLGFIIKDKIFTPEIRPLTENTVIADSDMNQLSLDEEEAAEDKEEYNVFDYDEDYVIPVKKSEQKSEKKGESQEEAENKPVQFVDFSAPFFKNPEKFKNEIVTMDVQMIFARKVDTGWRLNLMHVDSEKGVKYVYLDSDLLLTDKIELKIGYFYRITFKCVLGELDKSNLLLSIYPTGKKADWATGVSAIE